MIQLCDLVKQRSEIDQPIVSWVFPIAFFENGSFVSIFPVSVKLIFPLRWIVAWQFCLPIPTGPSDAFHHVPWTCAPSVSLGGFELDLLIRWAFICFPVTSFAFCDLGGVIGALAAEG